MKVITIGRDPSCDIVINDPQISRRHAIVRVSDTGKIEIVDLSSNGTSVNGNPLRKNVPYPVTRKNQVTFAGVSKLNWSDIPDPAKLYRWIGLGLLGLIATAIIITLIVKATGGSDEPVDPPTPTPIEQTQGTDTSSTDAKKDSTTNASQDDKTTTNSSESTNDSYNHLLKSSETKANSSTTTDVKTTSSSTNTTNSTVKSTSSSANVSTSSGKKDSKGKTSGKTEKKTNTGTTNGGTTNSSSGEEKKSTGERKDRKG